MPTLEQQFHRQMARLKLLDQQQTLIVAVSTGVDSMSLLTLLLSINVSQRPRIVVAHVNHELRAQSKQEEQFLLQYCHQHQLPCEVKHWPVASHPKHGVEAAGRKFRYQFFADLMQRWHAAAVLTAHHADDQAETFLMKLTRGGALQQLQGIAVTQAFQHGQLVRPLLRFSKQQLQGYAVAQKIRYFEDETNHSIEFQRNRLRHIVVPELKQENPQLLKHIADYQEQLTNVLAVANTASDQVLHQITIASNRYCLSSWSQIAPTLRRLLLQRLLLERTGLGSGETVLEQTDRWLQNHVHQNGQLTLLGEWQLVVSNAEFSILPAARAVKKAVNFNEIMVILNQWQKIASAFQVAVFDQQSANSDDGYSIWIEPTELPLKIRHWRSTDRLRLSNGQTQSVKKALQNAKISASDRHQWPLVVNSQDQPLWIPMVRASWLPSQAGKQQFFLQAKDIRGLKGETSPNE